MGRFGGRSGGGKGPLGKKKKPVLLESDERTPMASHNKE